MTNIAIIYFSGAGNTHLMAESIATGAQAIPDTGDRLSCELYGQRIAAATKRWQK